MNRTSLLGYIIIIPTSSSLVPKLLSAFSQLLFIFSFRQAMPVFRDQKRFPELVDPLLEDYPAKGLSQAVAVAAMCLQEEPSVRPLMSDVVAALSSLTIEPTGPDSASNDSLSEDFDCQVLARVG